MERKFPFEIHVFVWCLEEFRHVAKCYSFKIHLAYVRYEKNMMMKSERGEMVGEEGKSIECEMNLKL